MESRIVRTVLVFCLISVGARTVRSDEHFQSFECYKDLCVDRLMFCHEREQRCKMCTRAYCLPSARTPEQCKPHCPELLRTTTAEPTTTQTPATRPSIPTTVISTVLTEKLTEAGDSTIVLSRETLIGAAAVVSLVILAILVLVIITLCCVNSLHQKLGNKRSGSQESSVGLEEGQALLWERRSSGDKADEDKASGSSGSSTPARKDPALEIPNPSTVNSGRSAYTAMPESATTRQVSRTGVPDTGSTDSLHHHKGCDYRLAPLPLSCGPPPYHHSQHQHRPAFPGAMTDMTVASPYTETTLLKSV
ncbi:hypothetical protein BaRGS_00015444 [Batillaria attramentaria]|uniref:TNFR-Cys domain-containing protein n=1 Tax=Batillaria attramentaria TaxID=370345 RepID=A0ABD0L1W8_9CAEN